VKESFKISLLPKLLIPVFFAADIITKLLVVNYLPYQKYVPVWGRFLGFTYIFNPGAAFGIFGGLNPLIKNIAFTLITVIAIIFVFHLMLKTYKGKKIYQYACALILGGAFGNVSDRIFGYMLYGKISSATGFNSGRAFKLYFGKVVDFVNIGFGNPYGKWRWAYFNIADACISIGLVILIILILFSKDKSSENKTVKAD
jgi:signal peptidase II